MLCQEFQIKCFIVKSLEPFWEKFAKSLACITRKSGKQNRVGTQVEQGAAELTCVDTYVTEGFRLWKSLLCIRANLNFVDCRNFGAHLSLPLYSLQVIYNFIFNLTSLSVTVSQIFYMSTIYKNYI